MARILNKDIVVSEIYCFSFDQQKWQFILFLTNNKLFLTNSSKRNLIIGTLEVADILRILAAYTYIPSCSARKSRLHVTRRHKIFIPLWRVLRGRFKTIKVRKLFLPPRCNCRNLLSLRGSLSLSLPVLYLHPLSLDNIPPGRGREFPRHTLRPLVNDHHFEVVIRGKLERGIHIPPLVIRWLTSPFDFLLENLPNCPRYDTIFETKRCHETSKLYRGRLLCSSNFTFLLIRARSAFHSWGTAYFFTRVFLSNVTLYCCENSEYLLTYFLTIVYLFWIYTSTKRIERIETGEDNLLSCPSSRAYTLLRGNNSSYYVRINDTTANLNPVNKSSRHWIS